MIQGLIGRKLGMTQIFDDAGVVHPVTVIECGPNVVTQVKTTENDGYEAVQLGFGIDKRLNTFAIQESASLHEVATQLANGSIG